jgi:lysylphosphatidylglycerol synthetase-like protein (DUF2156 family)
MIKPTKRSRPLVIMATLALSVLAMVGNYYLSRPMPSKPLVSTEKTHQDLERIETIINAKDDETAKAITLFFDALIQEEDERTSLLQHRASSLLGTVSVVVTIILAGLSILIKDALHRLEKSDSLILLCLGHLTMILFGASLFWTWSGFTVRGDFATHNPDDFIEVMNDDQAGLRTFQVLRSLENYEINQINAKVNSAKARAPRMATGNLFLGLLVFSLCCLFLLLRIDANTSVEVNRDGEEEKREHSQEGGEQEEWHGRQEKEGSETN